MEILLGCSTLASRTRATLLAEGCRGLLFEVRSLWKP